MPPRARIGIDLGGTKIEGIRLEPDGSIAQRLRVATPRDDYRRIVAAIADLVRELEAGAPSPCPVGVGIPGTRSPATGLIKNANTVCLIGHALDRDLATALERPVHLANDADCFALSEAADGAGAGAASVFGIILGTGCGSGLVYRGQLIQGPNAIAGEWGHNPLPWPRPDELPGPRCYCGQAGCLETWISGTGLARDHAQRSGRLIEASEVVAAAQAGDARAEESLQRYFDRLARALAHVINIFDPEVVVAGGGVSRVARIYDEVPRRWGRYVFSDRVDTRFMPNKHGDSSGVRGAAWLWPLDPST